jgi:hypothetical protein
LDAITHDRALCNPDGAIGAAGFEAMMREQVRAPPDARGGGGAAAGRRRTRTAAARRPPTPAGRPAFAFAGGQIPSRGPRGQRCP